MKFSEIAKVLEEIPLEQRTKYKGKPVIVVDGEERILFAGTDFGLSLLSRDGTFYQLNHIEILRDDWKIFEGETWK